MPTTPALSRLSEMIDDLCGRLVEPYDDMCDDDGRPWLAVAGGDARAGVAHNENDLARIRGECRALAAGNECAINGHENRVSYIVGAGHTYRASLKHAHTADPRLALDAQAALDRFARDNQWRRRQQEIVLRRDRDGEVFLRFFTRGDGSLAVRFVEPGQVATPAAMQADPAASFGIATERGDVENAHAYFIDGQAVDAGEIQHRKANVDANVKRGLPLFYPVRKNLRRAEKMLRNMSTVAEIQSAIALIRKHRQGTRTAVEQFVSTQADRRSIDPVTGAARTYRRYAPGTILDAHSGIEYEFPAAGIDAASFVTVLQAELRAIASRLVMPEFMLTSDASNANYASTMVAEGPAMRLFQRLQAEQADDDLAVMWRVIDAAVAAGRLSPQALAAIDIQAVPPSLAVRDALADAQVQRILHDSGILSPQTWSQRASLDYAQEQTNLRTHAAPSDTRRAAGEGEH